MSPLQVFRIQDEEGKGPWASARNDRSFSPYNLHVNKMPSTYTDTLIGADWKQMSGYRHGFTTSQFQQWVDASDRQMLKRAGFKIVTYMCPPGTWGLGKAQVVFDATDGLPVEQSEL